MKFYIATIIIIFLFSSCLKQSIADAMLEAKTNSEGGGTASLSYDLNGNHVQVSVADAGDQPPTSYTLGCSKYAGYYSLDALGSTGETSFLFYTDSLSTMQYNYVANYGDMYFIDYNNQAEYVHAPNDILSVTITSYKQGHISGIFSGKLTPLAGASGLNNIYGASSSILITNGTFQNVPVFY